MTAATTDTISCRRFLAAWARSQASKEQSMDKDVFTHYQQLALHFQHLIHENSELKALETDISSVLSTIDAHEKEEGCVGETQRIPRASELAKLREKRTHVAKTCSKSETLLKEQDLQPAVSKNVDTKEVHATSELRSDLSANDFKSMLEVAIPQEEKLSTKTIRKRLGLVDRSKVQTSASETVVREEQESIQSEIMLLAKQLKDRTQTINQSLSEDAKILDAVGQSAESNTALLDRENTKLKEQLASSIGLWTSLWLVAMLIVVFVVTYFYMKVFSRRL